jgi:hypothetical protein
MNLRKITVKYMGWCPGVKAAARFVPDRDVPPIRFAVFVVLIGSVALSSYLIAQKLLMIYGIPPSESVTINNFRPKLIVVGDDLLLTTDVEIGYGLDVLRKGQVCLAKLTTEGRITDVGVILDHGGAFISTMDLLATKDGKWYMVYQLSALGSYPYQGSELKLISSNDRKSWEKPVIIFKAGFKSLDFEDVSLTEVDKGEIFLCYRKWDKETNDHTVFYSKYTPQNGWGPQEEAPFNWYSVSSFLDKDDVPWIVGVEYGRPFPHPYYFTNRTYISRMGEDGGWIEPIDLNYVRGVRAQVFYSRIRDGYFLVTNGKFGDDYVQLSFSDDLKNWGLPITFGNARRPTFAELSNGTLILVFERFFEPPPDVLTRKAWTELFISTSPDGLNWSTPQKVETIVDERGLESILSFRRSVASAFASIPIVVCLILLLYKRPNFGFRQSKLKNNGIRVR